MGGAADRGPPPRHPSSIARPYSAGGGVVGGVAGGVVVPAGGGGKVSVPAVGTSIRLTSTRLTGCSPAAAGSVTRYPYTRTVIPTFTSSSLASFPAAVFTATSRASVYVASIVLVLYVGTWTTRLPLRRWETPVWTVFRSFTVIDPSPILTTDPVSTPR